MGLILQEAGQRLVVSLVGMSEYENYLRSASRVSGVENELHRYRCLDPFLPLI